MPNDPNISDRNQNGNGERAPEPRPNARSWQEFAAEINGLHRRRVEDIHAIGRLLVEAYIELSDSGAYEYLLHKLDFGPRNARLYIKIVRNPVLVKRKYISSQPASLTKLVELTKLPLAYLERQFERGKITPAIEIETIKEWVEEQKTSRVDWDNAPAHGLWFVDHFIPQYPEPGPQHARRFITEDGFTLDNCTTLIDWLVKLRAAELKRQEQERRRLAEDDRRIERENQRLQAGAERLSEWDLYAATADAEEEGNDGEEAASEEEADEGAEEAASEEEEEDDEDED
jgi:hypothetical protein